MKLTNILILLLLVAGSVIPSYGQKKWKKSLITGYVTDAQHYPVSNAAIITDGNKTGIYTDQKGYYKVRTATGSKSIAVFSYSLGTLEENLNGRTRINFAFPGTIREQITYTGQELIPEKKEEQVNVGYGKMNRSGIVSSVSSLDGRNPLFSSFSSVYDMLQGTVPGVFVNGNNVLIRGVTSYRLSNEPLYIVDGIPVSSIDYISPQMVKSVEVLKGQATSIYGSRGANGVILFDLTDAPEVNDSQQNTLKTMPAAETQAAANVLAKTATLNGVVAANDISCFVSFEYGTTTAYGNKVAASRNPVTGSSPSLVTALIDGLEADMTYHFRVLATNSQGSATGADLTFTTTGSAPAAQTGPATSVSPRSARLNGKVNAQLLPTAVAFEYGTTADYGATITASENLAGNGPVNVSSEVTGLEPGTTYHYRIVATNEKGTAVGNDTSFTARYTIGEYVNGGYIFYLDGTGEHGLVCAPADQSGSALWGSCIPEGASGKAKGTGSRNTADIINGCPAKTTAARICYDLQLNGYNDWFLPSVDELFLMYSNLHGTDIGGFADTFYWSSSQDMFGAWVVSYHYGSKSNHRRDEDSIRTRAVRAF